MLIILFIHAYGPGSHTTKHNYLSSQFWLLKFSAVNLAFTEFSLNLVIGKNMHGHFQNMSNLRLCNSTTVRYCLSKFRHMLRGIDSDYFQSHLCKCNSWGCIEAIKRGDVCHGPHRGCVYSGSEHNQYDSPGIVKGAVGFPIPRRVLIGSNQPWGVNYSSYYHWGLMTALGVKFDSILDNIMACCLMEPSHYLNRCWPIINGVRWHSPETNFAESAGDNNS